MKTLGLDIGTTTISAVVAENGAVLSALTLKNDSFLPAENPWERIQDPNYIRSTALSAVEQLLQQQLPGYAEYMTRVRWRLIPYIW